MTRSLALDGQISEAEFQRAVLDLAHLAGWRSMHVRRSVVRGEQWATATSVTGWPDLALWRPGRFLVVELKAQRGRLSPAQRDVLDSLTAAGVEVDVWRPSDWVEIESTLLTRHGCSLDDRGDR